MANLDMARGQTRENKIRLHGTDAFEGMRRAGQLAAAALDMLVEHVKPGVTTERLDDLIMEFAVAHDAIPAPLNYRGFPKAICTSVNHVVCHGIPNSKPLKDGDIINIDVTLIVDGWHGDTSRMYAVGNISRRAERLIDVTYEALMRGVSAVKPGHTTGHIGAAIQTFAEEFVFRGYLTQGLLVATRRTIPTVLISGALFGAMHIPNGLPQGPSMAAAPTVEARSRRRQSQRMSPGVERRRRDRSPRAEDRAALRYARSPRAWILR